MGFVSRGVTCGILVAVVMLRYRGRDSAGNGLPMAKTIQTKMPKNPNKNVEAQPQTETQMKVTARNSMTTVNPIADNILDRVDI